MTSFGRAVRCPWETVRRDSGCRRAADIRHRAGSPAASDRLRRDRVLDTGRLGRELRTATVATLGLNPSRIEFVDAGGDELPDAKRRLATRRSLGVTGDSMLTDAEALRVVADCDAYFKRNPYWRWFGQLQAVLHHVGASYSGSNPTACHLDVAQWATDPVWGRLAPAARRRLVADGLGFLDRQLIEHEIELVLINGRSVIDVVMPRLEKRRIRPLSRGRLVTGVLCGVRTVGWTTNLQSSFGVTNDFRAEMAAAVASAR